MFLKKVYMFFEKVYIFLKSIYFLRKAPFRTPYISLGEYINAVVSRIVIGPLDLKIFCQNLSIFADVSEA